MNLLIDSFLSLNDLGLNVSQEKANAHDPLTNVRVIAVSVSIAEMETCHVSFSTKQALQSR